MSFDQDSSRLCHSSLAARKKGSRRCQVLCPVVRAVSFGLIGVGLKLALEWEVNLIIDSSVWDSVVHEDQYSFYLESCGIQESSDKGISSQILFRKVSVETCNYEDIKPEFVFLRENERLSEIINFSLFYPPHPHGDLYFSLILKTIS